MPRQYLNPFVPRCPYKWELGPNTLRIDRILFDDLITWMSADGRPLGILADRLICARFDNLAIPRTDCESFDILEYPVGGGCRSYEVKTASKGNAADLLTSSMKGKGRIFNADVYSSRRDGLYGYIVLDVSRLPQVRMIGLPMADVVRGGYERRIPRKAIDRLFAGDMFAEGHVR